MSSSQRDPQVFDSIPMQAALATAAHEARVNAERIEVWRSLLHELVDQSEQVLGDVFDGLDDDALDDDKIVGSVREVFRQIVHGLNFYRNMAVSAPCDIAPGFIDLMHAERRRQIAKWGDQTPPLTPPSMRGLPNDVLCRALGIPTEREAKARCDNHNGDISMAAVMLEEQIEALCASNQYTLRVEADADEEVTQQDIAEAACAVVEELVQVATVAAKAATPIMRKHKIVVRNGRAFIDGTLSVPLASDTAQADDNGAE